MNPGPPWQSWWLRLHLQMQGVHVHPGQGAKISHDSWPKTKIQIETIL